MNILLIQLLRLGDAIQLIPIIRGLKTHLQDCRISVLTSVVGKNVFEQDPGVDAVHVLSKQEMAELVGRSRKTDILHAIDILNADLAPILDTNWDWVINFSYSYPSALLSFLLKADRRSGFVVNDHRHYLSRENWFSLSLASFVHRNYSNFNWVDINRKIIGLPLVPKHPLLRPTPEAMEKANVHLRTIGFEGRKIVGINPGASGAYKMWPVQKFGHLGRSLAENHDFRVLVFGGKGEAGLGRMLKGLIGEKAEDLTGRTTLDELAAFLSLCDVLVTNDTGPMHLACTVDTRVISLFFNTHFVETGPYGKDHVALHPDIPCFPCQGPAKCQEKKCLSYISPENVAKIILNGTASNSVHSFTNTEDSDTIQAHVADFDPWDLLEWVPLGKPPLTMSVMERAVLRASWLHHCDMIPDEDAGKRDHLVRSLKRYSIPENRDELLSKLAGLRDGLLAFRATLDKAHAYAMQLQSETINPRRETHIINRLGVKLGSVEQELFSTEKDSSISFIAELLKVYLEGIEHSSIEDLAGKTASIYREIIRFTDLVIAREAQVAKILYPKYEQEKILAFQ